MKLHVGFQFLVICALCGCIYGSDESAQVRDEDNLMSYLTRATPDTAVLPPRPDDGAAPVKVNLGLQLVYVKEVEDSRKGFADVRLSTWDKYAWTDSRLSWDPEQFGGLKDTRIPLNKIWTPDILQYSSLDVEPKVNLDVLAVVYYTGYVLMIPPSERSVRCAANGKADQDKWTCDFVIGSWTYDSDHLDIGFFDEEEKIDVSDFKENLSGYYIEENKGVYQKKKYDCCEELYPSITFTLGLCAKDD